MHPSFRSLAPLLDALSSELPGGTLPVLLSPPYVVPSSQYTAEEYSSSLSRHLLSLIPPASPALNDIAPSHDRDATVTSKGTDPALLNGKDPPKGPDSAALFLGMPAVNLNVTKWNWSGYMSFGRGMGKKNSSGEKNPIPASFTELPEDAPVGPAPEVVVDKDALEDAISEHISITVPDPLDEHAKHTSDVPTLDDVDPPEPNGFQTSHERIPADSGSASPVDSVTSAPPEPPQLEFSSTRVYLAKSNDPLITVPQKVFYLLVSSLKPSFSRKM